MSILSGPIPVDIIRLPLKIPVWVLILFFESKIHTVKKNVIFPHDFDLLQR
jgi:hypothetical protein